MFGMRSFRKALDGLRTILLMRSRDMVSITALAVRGLKTERAALSAARSVGGGWSGVGAGVGPQHRHVSISELTVIL